MAEGAAVTDDPRESEWYHFACWLKLTPEQRDKLCGDATPLLAALAQALSGEIAVDNVFLGHDKPELPHIRLGAVGQFSDEGWVRFDRPTLEKES